MMFFFGVYKMLSHIGNLQTPINDIEKRPSPTKSEANRGGITESNKSVKRGLIRNNMDEGSRSELMSGNQDRGSENLPVSSNDVDLLQHPPQPEVETLNSLELDEEKMLPDIDTRPKGICYSVHFGSYKNLSNAKEKVELLSGKGLHAWWKKVNIDGKGEWFRVYVGEYKTKADALSIIKRLRATGINGYFNVQRLSLTD
jgi:hypothetical protein